MSEDRIKIIRILEYSGPRKWVEDTLRKSAIGPRKTIPISPPRFIKEVYCDYSVETWEEKEEEGGDQVNPED